MFVPIFTESRTDEGLQTEGGERSRDPGTVGLTYNRTQKLSNAQNESIIPSTVHHGLLDTILPRTRIQGISHTITFVLQSVAALYSPPDIYAISLYLRRALTEDDVLQSQQYICAYCI